MEGIEEACKDPCNHNCNTMCKNQLEVMLETIRESSPNHSFTSKKTRVKKGQFKGIPLYQIKKGWSFFGKLFGKVVAEFSARNPRTLLTYDSPICDILYEKLPKELKIKNIYYSYKP